ncbi:MAG: TonB family protein [Paraglaciecola sp.]|jgi:TonB family protein
MTHLPAVLLIMATPFIFSHANANGVNIEQGNNQASSQLVSTSVVPIPVSRVAPKYPISMARAGGEGWVQMSFVISKNGTVIDPVIADSSGSRGFEKAALRAIKKWQYSPAMVDGEAIEQCQNKVQIDFKLQNSAQAVRRRFRSAYIKAKEAMDEKDMSTAMEYMVKLRDDKQFNGMESAWFWMLEADFARVNKDQKAELSNIKRAINTDRDGKLLGAGNYLSMLQQRFVLEIQSAQYADALDTFDSIKTRDNSEAMVHDLQKYATQISQLLAGDEPIFVAAKIAENGSWWHKLSRSSFAFSDVKGQLDRIELRCNNKRQIYTFADDSTWHIPETWGRCSVLVVGDKNVDFNLVELSPQA